MALTKHDAEEATRQIEGTVYDAAEKVGEARAVYELSVTKEAAEKVIAAQSALINRQLELIAELQNLLVRAVA